MRERTFGGEAHAEMTKMSRNRHVAYGMGTSEKSSYVALASWSILWSCSHQRLGTRDVLTEELCRFFQYMGTVVITTFNVILRKSS